MNMYSKILIAISFCPEQLGIFFSLLVYIDVKCFQMDKSDIWIYYLKDFCLIVIGVPQVSVSTVITCDAIATSLAVSRICISVVL